jgi:spore germination protein YaaH
VRRTATSLLLILATTTAMLGAPAPIAAVGPGGASTAAPIPPLLPDGPIRLPNGKLLPVAPAWAPRSSAEAEMLAEHEHDSIPFTPGARPRPRDAGVTTALAPLGGSEATLLGLADPTATPSATLASLPNGLRKEVLGFLPYWMLTDSALQWMQYQLVSTIAYFGIAARSNGSLATGTTGWNGWYSSRMTNVINAAHSRHDRVVVTIAMMAWDGGAAQATLLGSSTYRAALVTNIIKVVKDRSADGVNLDFEPVSTTLRNQYTSFVRQLKKGLVDAGAGSYLTVDTMAGAATWATGYDLAGLTATGAANQVFVMGYDYSWSGSSRAGGVAPMDSPYILDVNESVDDYLSVIPGSKIIWGVPYYGRTWLTQSSVLNALTKSGASGSSKAYYYTGAAALAAAHGRLWDSVGRVPWFRYYDGTAASWVEGYYDDPASLGVKWDMVNQRGLAGTGMWTLLMDQGTSALWNLIARKFVTDTSAPAGGITLLPQRTDTAAVHVSWKAVDVGSGVASYRVQVRDRSSTTWTTWLSATGVTSAYYIGLIGHRYEFRMSAIDFKGNAQPWVAPMPDPGSSIAVGRFAKVAIDTLNVRAGAGTSQAVLAQLTSGNLVNVMAGPIAASGYSWYQVQYGFAEWPSADYPRVGWVAAADGSTAYLTPATAPTVTTLAPTITGYAASPRRFSPNGDGLLDTASVRYAIPTAASVARLDVVSSTNQIVDNVGLGALSAGSHAAAWDGKLASGAPAPDGTYLLRISVTDAIGAHFAPAIGVDARVLAAWGVTVDRTAPTLAGHSPTGVLVPITTPVSVTFSEGVSGVSSSSLMLTDTVSGLPVAGTVTYASTTHRASLVPAVALARGRTYRVSLSSSIRDAVGNPLAPTAWNFATIPLGVTIYDPARALTFRAATTTGYHFDAAGKVVATKTYTLTRASSAATSQRSRIIPGHSGAWFYAVNGIWAGYWVRESPTVYLPGISEKTTFSPVRSVWFAAGTWTGYKFDTSGHVVASKRYPLSRSSWASANARAIINGRSYVAIVNGVWAGYWVPESSSIVLK